MPSERHGLDELLGGASVMPRGDPLNYGSDLLFHIAINHICVQPPQSCLGSQHDFPGRATACSQIPDPVVPT
jgi:hypothetical protein